jgi:proteic killer suppression protein
MIRSWKNAAAREAFEGRTPKGFSAEIAKAARRRLAQLDAAAQVEDMRTPPGNRLKKVGDVWSVRVNDQFRITFSWGADGPSDVWLGDYH